MTSLRLLRFSIARLLIVLATIAGVACGRGNDAAPAKAGGEHPPAADTSGKATPGKAAPDKAKADDHDDGDKHGDEHADEKHDEDEQDTLRIDADTLRDLRITIAPVETRAAAETLTLLGELGVNEEAYAEVSAPIAARVTRLVAAAGDDVRAGQALVVLQSREIGEALGALHSATARVTLARQALERKRTLAAERITPQRSVEEAEAELVAAEAAERAARASLNAIGISVPTTARNSGTAIGSGSGAGRSDANVRSGRGQNASGTSGAASADASRSDARSGNVGGNDASDAGGESGLVLRSPVSGTVLERTVAIGQLADPAKPLFRVAQLGTLWLTVHAFERDAVRLSRGTDARVSFAALPGETFAGTIARVGQQVDPTSRTVAVRIDLPNPKRRLKPGMSASAVVPIGTRGDRVLTVPAAALQRVRERWCVFVPDPDAKPGSTTRFHIRAVARGRELDGEVEILDGLAATDRVVSDGAFVLKAELDKRAGSGDAHAH
jgi:membrane fusion protein, heavy metal efflux system